MVIKNLLLKEFKMTNERINIYTSGRFTTIGRFKDAVAPIIRADGSRERIHHFIKTPGSFKQTQITCYEPEIYVEGRLANHIKDIGNAGERVRIYPHDIFGNYIGDFLPFDVVQENSRLKSENKKVKNELNNSVRETIELKYNYEKRIDKLLKEMKEIRSATFIPNPQDDGN